MRRTQVMIGARSAAVAIGLAATLSACFPFGPTPVDEGTAPNDTLAQAVPIPSLPARVRGTVGATEELDVFSFTSPAGTLVVTCDPSPGAIFILFNDTFSDGRGCEGSGESISWPGGPGYLQLSRVAPAAAPYSLLIERN